MSWLEEKYISLISARLDQFQRVNSGLYNFRCPHQTTYNGKQFFCGDSKKNRYKKRGYLYEKNGQYRYHCHNCSTDLTFYMFLKLLDPALVKQFSFEKHNPNVSQKSPPKPNSQKSSESATRKYSHDDMGVLDKLLDRLDVLPESNPAVQYAKSRLIPKDKWNRLYYLDDTSKIGQLSPIHKERIKGTEERLLIPAFSKEGHLIGITARALVETTQLKKYIAIGLSDSQIIYGLDSYDINKVVCVVEGPLDSLFLENSLAVGSSFLMKAKNHIDKSRDILVFDNEPRNKEIVKIAEKALKEGYRVVIWPHYISQKDVNAMVKAGISNVQDIIYQNAFSGLLGLTKISTWRKT